MTERPFSFLRGLNKIDGATVDRALQELRTILLRKSDEAECHRNPSAKLAYNDGIALVEACRDALAMADRE